MNILWQISSLFNSSICFSIVAPSYAFICRKFCFTKWLSLVLTSFFAGIFFSYNKKKLGKICSWLNHILEVVTWNLLEYICVSVIKPSGYIETNLVPKHSFSSQELFFFSIWVLFHENSRFTGPQREGEGIPLTPHCHFHPLHRHLHICRAVATERLLLP